MNIQIKSDYKGWTPGGIVDEMKQGLKDINAMTREEAIPRFNHDLAEDESGAFHRVNLSLWDSKKCHSET